MEINVLWIDDEPNEAFMDSAYNRGISITNAGNVDAGIEMLLAPTSSFDAILLDANCVYHRADDPSVPDVSALQYALRKITEKGITLPWFVYSGGGFDGEKSISVLVKGYERPYDEKDWYRKPVERSVLFDKILEVVPQMSEYKIKHKYRDILCWYPNPKELLDILSYIEEDKQNNPDVFNKIRKELDWLMTELYERGLLLEPYTGSNLAECSKFLGQDILAKYDFVPMYIQRGFHSAVSICNEGSHRLKIDDYVKNGRAPYLVQSTICEFLNILSWLGKLPFTEEGRETMKMDVKEVLENAFSKDNADFTEMKRQYEGATIIVEQDEDGICHCGKCFVLSHIAKPHIGKEVKLFSVSRNTKESKEKYPLFGRIKVEQ